LPTLGRTFWPVWQKKFSWGKKKIIQNQEHLLSKSCLSKSYKRGLTFSDIGQFFWLDWPGSYCHVDIFEDGQGEHPIILLVSTS
jgi:hypothetical protein